MQLYEPLIERDLGAIPGAVRQFRGDHSSDELFLAVARFALLAFAPSQHAKHALLACLAVHELREELGERLDEAVTELAIYAAGSRQPWSEPPIPDPPSIAADQRGDLEELLAAIETGDRHRAERWLAGRLDDPQLARDYFTAAANDLEDMGHKLIVSTAAWKLVPILGERGKYATLRVGVWEMTAYRGSLTLPGHAMPPEALLAALVDEAIASHGSLESVHAVFLLDAALTASSLMNDDSVLRRVCDGIGSRPRRAVSAPATMSPALPIYRYARDYAQSLLAHAVAKRLRPRFPQLPLDAFIAAAHDNLEHAASFEEWSFA